MKFETKNFTAPQLSQLQSNNTFNYDIEHRRFYEELEESPVLMKKPRNVKAELKQQQGIQKGARNQAVKNQSE